MFWYPPWLGIVVNDSLHWCLGSSLGASIFSPLPRQRLVLARLLVMADVFIPGSHTPSAGGNGSKPSPGTGRFAAIGSLQRQAADGLTGAYRPLGGWYTINFLHIRSGSQLEAAASAKASFFSSGWGQPLLVGWVGHCCSLGLGRILLR